MLPIIVLHDSNWTIAEQQKNLYWGRESMKCALKHSSSQIFAHTYDAIYLFEHNITIQEAWKDKPNTQSSFLWALPTEKLIQMHT